VKVMTPHYGKNAVLNRRGPGDIQCLSLFPILCSCPVHHIPAALVLSISIDQ